MIRFYSFAVALMLALMPAIAFDLGDDGLHKPTWLRETFKDLREDLAEANAEGTCAPFTQITSVEKVSSQTETRGPS